MSNSENDWQENNAQRRSILEYWIKVSFIVCIVYKIPFATLLICVNTIPSSNNTNVKLVVMAVEDRENPPPKDAVWKGQVWVFRTCYIKSPTILTWRFVRIGHEQAESRSELVGSRRLWKMQGFVTRMYHHTGWDSIRFSSYDSYIPLGLSTFNWYACQSTEHPYRSGFAEHK